MFCLTSTCLEAEKQESKRKLIAEGAMDHAGSVDTVSVVTSQRALTVDSKQQ